jgi:transposase
VKRRIEVPLTERGYFDLEATVNLSVADQRALLARLNKELGPWVFEELKAISEAFRAKLYAETDTRIRDAMRDAYERDVVTPRHAQQTLQTELALRGLAQGRAKGTKATREAGSATANRIVAAAKEMGQPLTASALVASVGDAKLFHNGRQFAAWLGLVPRQNSSGGKTNLLGISKRGDTYLRTLLIHGARSVLFSLKRDPASAEKWLMRVADRRNPNIAAVALANKNARTVWALLAHDRDFKMGYRSSTPAAA